MKNYLGKMTKASPTSKSTETVKETPSKYDTNAWQDRSIALGNAMNMMADFVKHRVNTEVNSLDMINQLIRETPLNDEQQELVSSYEQISAELCDLIKTIDENVELTQYDFDKVQQIELQPIFDQVKQDFTSEIEKYDATFYADFSEVPHINFEPKLLRMILEKFIKSSLCFDRSGKKLEMKVYTVTKPSGDHLVFENNAPIAGILKKGETSDQAMFGNNLIRAIQRCGGHFEAARKNNYGNRYSVIFN